MLSNLNVRIEYVALICCLQIAALFAMIYLRRRDHREHLVFSLFCLLLACISECRNFVDDHPVTPTAALIGLRIVYVLGCVSTAIYIHFTLLITSGPRQASFVIRVVYLLSILGAGTVLAPTVTHPAPPAAPTTGFDDGNIGPLFPAFTLVLVLAGLGASIRLIALGFYPQRPTELHSQTDSNLLNPLTGDDPVEEVVLFRRHFLLIGSGTAALMAGYFIDISWFINPNYEPPIHAGPIGTIVFVTTVGIALGREFIRNEIRLRTMKTIAQARSLSLTYTQHQLKNQIAAVRMPLCSAVQLLGDGTDKVAARTKLSTALDEATDLQNTLEIMLNVARLDAGKLVQLGKKSRVQLAEVIHDLCIRRAARSSCSSTDRFLIEDALPHPTVSVFDTPLKQVLTNLIDNAFKYSPDDSQIRIRLEPTGCSGEIRIRVADQGRGVCEEDRERIFNEPFYRPEAGEAGSSGTGLGLNLAKRYMEAMGGRLWVESPGTGQGSEFIVILPVGISPQRSRVVETVDDRAGIEY